MPKKIYVKDESFDPIYKEVSKGFYTKARVLPTTLVIAGILVFITQVVLPLVVFKTTDTSYELVDNATVLGRASGFSDFEFKELENITNTKPEIKKPIELESTQQEKPKVNSTSIVPHQKPEVESSNIVRKNIASKPAENANTPEFFYITIPKLGIENALVETNADTLNPINALGHYAGTEVPGEVGNAFIYGHSVLPWFFNPNNYKTIFATLHKLEPGDKFYVNYNNRELTYLVESKIEEKPADVDPLAEIKPRYLNESTMVLMTCSPAGTKLRRLMINAVLLD